MKTKKYAILAFVLLTSILTICLVGQAISKTLQLEKDKKTGSNLTTLRKSGLLDKLIRPGGKEILHGLQGVHVVVEGIRPEAEKRGLTKQVLQTDTELQLRQYGIKVFTEEEWLRAQGYPGLYINVNVLILEEEPLAAIAIKVELQESVLLLREPIRVCFGACTWRRISVGTVGVNRMRDIREWVKDDVDEFINDYLAANPTKKPTVSSPATKAPQKGLISAIVVSEDSPYIFIDYRIYYERDTIDGVTVVKIYKDRVVFEKEGTEGKIRWTQKIGEAPKAHWNN